MAETHEIHAHGIPPAFDANECARRLRRAREAVYASQGEAARKLGVPRQHVSRWENGERVLVWNRLVRYVEELGLDWSIVLPEAAQGRPSAAPRTTPDT